VVPFHAANELDDDEISIFDIENIILTGTVVDATRRRQPGAKYLVRGDARRRGGMFRRQDRTHRRLVIITAWPKTSEMM
jgi:hypothetical protein